MNWPPSDSEWRAIFAGLPLNADPVRFRAMIEAAVQQYSAASDSKAYSDLWRSFSGQTRNALAKFRRNMLQLQAFPNDDKILELLRRSAESLNQVTEAADVQTHACLPSTRRERFLSSLSLAWTGPGKGNLSVSEAGPFVNFMCSIMDRVLPDPLSGRGIKAFAKRELARRKALEVVNEVLSGRGGLSVDDAGVSVIRGTFSAEFGDKYCLIGTISV